MPSNPYSVRLSAVSQRLATVTFMKPDSHGGVPISYYLVQYKEFGLQDWRDVKSHSIQSESEFPSVLHFLGGFKCQGFASESNPQYQWVHLCHSVMCTPPEMYTCSASQVFPPTHCNNNRLDCFLMLADHSERH